MKKKLFLSRNTEILWSISGILDFLLCRVDILISQKEISRNKKSRVKKNITVRSRLNLSIYLPISRSSTPFKTVQRVYKLKRYIYIYMYMYMYGLAKPIKALDRKKIYDPRIHRFHGHWLIAPRTLGCNNYTKKRTRIYLEYRGIDRWERERPRSLCSLTFLSKNNDNSHFDRRSIIIRTWPLERGEGGRSWWFARGRFAHDRFCIFRRIRVFLMATLPATHLIVSGQEAKSSN